MRMAGILARDPGKVEDFLGRLQHCVAERQHQRARLVVQPSRNSKVGLIIVDGCNPSVQCASLPDGSFAVLDGEVYTDNNLLADTASGDSEAAVAAQNLLREYMRSGTDAFARLNASAIAVIWDARRATLLISRDRYGSACAYFMEGTQGLYWSSDASPLLQTGMACSIDNESLDFFLAAGYVPAPWTPIKEIRKIPPGHTLRCRDGGAVEIEPYWRPTGRPKLQISANQRLERSRELLKTALQRRYGPQGHTGVLLSGGVDSTLLVAVCTKLLELPIDTFTFRYEQYEGPFNEGLPAQRIAEYFGTRHHEISIAPSDVESGLESIVRDYGEPFSYGLHSFKLREALDAKISTLISGAGIGDLYPGAGDLFACRYARLPTSVHALTRVAAPLLRRLSATLGRRIDNALWTSETGLSGNTNVPITADSIRARIYRENSHASGHRNIARCFAELGAGLDEESDRDRVALLLQRFFISECNLYWYNRWGRAHNLAFRHPYYDNDFQEFLVRLPRKGKDKPDVRELAATLMPQDMAYAPKVAHTIPIRQWFRGPLKEMLRSRLARDRIVDGNLFDATAVSRLVEAHINGHANHAWTLWGILTITVWQETVFRGG